MLTFSRQDLIEILDHLHVKYREYVSAGYIQICNQFVGDKKFHLGLGYKTQTYKCFKTGESGRLTKYIFKLLELHKVKLKDIHFSPTFAGWETVQNHTQTAETKELIKNIDLPQSCHKLEINSKSIANQLFKNYLNKRNISDQLIERYKLFYNVTDNIYKNRVIIPYYERDKVVFWTARAIDKKADKKYLYPLNAHKSEFVYNLDNNTDKKQLIICEGQFNAMVLDAVAVGGSSVSQKQIKLLANCKAEKVIVAFDQDEPGIKGSIDSCKKLCNYFKNIYYFKLKEQTKEDFCDWGAEKSIGLIENNLSKFSGMSELNELVGLL
jgi:DNA primase